MTDEVIACFNFAVSCFLHINHESSNSRIFTVTNFNGILARLLYVCNSYLARCFACRPQECAAHKGFGRYDHKFHGLSFSHNHLRAVFMRLAVYNDALAKIVDFDVKVSLNDITSLIHIRKSDHAIECDVRYGN